MGAIDIETGLRSGLVDLPLRQLDPEAELAAVALILAADHPELLFIKRAEHPRDPWSGHVALPGGRKDPVDSQIEQTARREVREEVGVHLGEDSFWGALPPVQARSRAGMSRMWVIPHVYRIVGPHPTLSLRTEEVAAARWIPVSKLLDPGRTGQIETRTQTGMLKLPAWNFDDFTIWGLTYYIVRQFLRPLIAEK